jgi:uncharacterized cupredoxin-like copper-binding protein
MDLKQMATANWSRVKKVGLTAILAGALSVSLAACGGDNTPVAQPTSTAAATQPTQAAQPTAGGDQTAKSGQQVAVELGDFYIKPSDLSVPAGNVTFVVSNAGNAPHNLTIQGSSGTVGKTPNFNKGDPNQDLTVDLQPGTYTWLCTVPGHASRGMKGTLTVTK